MIKDMSKKKSLRDYLHLYLPYQTKCLRMGEDGEYIMTGISWDSCQKLWWVYFADNDNDASVLVDVFPILRPLSSMTGEEGQHFAWLCMDSEYHLKKDSRIDLEDVQTDVVPNDGGNMLDGDILVYIDVSCICFTGGIAFHEDGSIYLTDEDGKQERALHDMAGKIHWLLSKHFDLFNLIPEKLAIDKSELITT